MTARNLPRRNAKFPRSSSRHLSSRRRFSHIIHAAFLYTFLASAPSPPPNQTTIVDWVLQSDAFLSSPIPTPYYPQNFSLEELDAAVPTGRGQDAAGGAARHDVAAVLVAARSEGVGADPRRRASNGGSGTAAEAQLGVGPGRGVRLGLGGSSSSCGGGGGVLVVLLLLLGVDGGWYRYQCRWRFSKSRTRGSENLG